MQLKARKLTVFSQIQLASAETLAEQREIWSKRVRRVLLSRLLAYFVIGSERFLWKALGVPGEQRAMIEEDYKRLSADAGDEVGKSEKSGLSGDHSVGEVSATKSGQAIWNYGVQTLDPVVRETLVSEDNHYYLVCLLGSSPHFHLSQHAFLTRLQQATTPANATRPT